MLNAQFIGNYLRISTGEQENGRIGRFLEEDIPRITPPSHYRCVGGEMSSAPYNILEEDEHTSAGFILFEDGDCVCCRLTLPTSLSRLDGRVNHG